MGCPTAPPTAGEAVLAVGKEGPHFCRGRCDSNNSFSEHLLQLVAVEALLYIFPLLILTKTPQDRVSLSPCIDERTKAVRLSNLQLGARWNPHAGRLDWAYRPFDWEEKENHCGYSLSLGVSPSHCIEIRVKHGLPRREDNPGFERPQEQLLGPVWLCQQPGTSSWSYLGVA